VPGPAPRVALGLVAGFTLVSLFGIGVGPAFAASKHGKSAAKTPPTTSPPNPANAVTDYPQLTGSATVLTFDIATVAALKTAGIDFAPLGTATAVDNGAGISLPITSGYAEVHANKAFLPNYLLGSVEHFGSGLSVTSGGVTVDVSDLVFDLGQSVVYASVGASEDVPMFTLVTKGVTVSETASTLAIDGSALDLTATGAAELDAPFHTAAITAKTEIATAAMSAAGRSSHYTYTAQTSEIPRLSGVSASVTFSSAALATFRQLGASPSAFGSASYAKSAAKITFPITGGSAVVHPGAGRQPSSLAGVILLQGSGLLLSRGSKSLTVSDLIFEPGGSAVYASVNGGADDARLFRLNTGTVGVSGGNVHISGAALDLTLGAAAMFNQAFATTDFKAGADFGAVELTASGD
jgi:hypothetical protein